MNERAQWGCEIAGLAAAAAGAVTVGAGLWGVLGAGLGLFAAALLLLVVGNVHSGED